MSIVTCVHMQLSVNLATPKPMEFWTSRLDNVRMIEEGIPGWANQHTYIINKTDVSCKECWSIRFWRGIFIQTYFNDIYIKVMAKAAANFDCVGHEKPILSNKSWKLYWRSICAERYKVIFKILKYYAIKIKKATYSFCSNGTISAFDNAPERPDKGH